MYFLLKKMLVYIFNNRKKEKKRKKFGISMSNYEKIYNNKEINW